MNLINNSSSDRFHSIDMLRAIMMVLGVFFHSAVIFCHSKNIQDWPVFDKSPSYFFDFVVGITHSFRMHIFFFVSGFSTSILYLKKGSKLMLINRFKRIVLPFLLSYVIISPLISYFSALINNSEIGNPIVNLFHLDYTFFLSQPIYHLWFLYYLIYFILLGWIFEKLFEQKLTLTEKIKSYIEKITRNFWLRFVFLSSLILIYFLYTGKNHFYSPLKFEISPSAFLVYFVFYAFGWFVHKNKSLLLLSSENPTRLVTLGFVFYIISNLNVILGFSNFKYVQFTASAISHVLFILGFLSLVLRKFNFQSKISTFILNSSYWIYLVHIIFIFAMYYLIGEINLPVYLKFITVFLGASFLCILSYLLFVKKTFIGVFLIGKKIK
jgi:glucan biosynthesis protein C